MKAKGQVDLRIIPQEKWVFCKPTLRYIHNIENIQDFTVDFEQKSSPSISDLLDGNGAAPDYLYCGYKLISAYLHKLWFSCCSNPPWLTQNPSGRHKRAARATDVMLRILLCSPSPGFGWKGWKGERAKTKPSEQWYDINKPWEPICSDPWGQFYVGIYGEPWNQNIYKASCQRGVSGSEAILWLLNGVTNNSFKSTLQCSMPLLPLGRDRVLKPATVKSHIIYSR